MCRPWGLCREPTTTSTMTTTGHFGDGALADNKNKTTDLLYLIYLHTIYTTSYQIIINLVIITCKFSIDLTFSKIVEQKHVKCRRI